MIVSSPQMYIKSDISYGKEDEDKVIMRKIMFLFETSIMFLEPLVARKLPDAVSCIAKWQSQTGCWPMSNGRLYWLGLRSRR